MRSRTRSIAAALAILLWPAAATAVAQLALPIGSAGTASPVLPSKDWEASAAAIGLDAAQRQVADRAFDDAQERMFEVRRKAQDALSRVDPGATDERSLAAAEDARRAQAEGILGEVDGLYRSLEPLVRPEQAAAVDRERLAARRRATRALLGGAASAGAVQWDIERVLERGGLGAEQRDAALAALAGYRERIGSRMQRLLEEELARPRRAARAGRTGKPGAGAPDDDLAEAFRRLAESRAAARDAATDLADAHRDALAAIQPLLPADALRKVQDTALARIWPRTGLDPDSPAKVLEQLLGGRAAPEQREALEAVRSAWRARWWSASLRMAEAEGEMGTGLAALLGEAAQDDRAASAKAAFVQARSDRRDADRDAWRALAAADPQRREFHEARASRERGDSGWSMPELPDAGGNGAPAMTNIGATVSATVGTTDGTTAAQDVAIEAASVVGTVMLVQQQVGDDGGEAPAEPDVMVLDAGTMETEGGFGMVMVAGDGEPIVFGDRFGDGMGSDAAFAGIAFEPDDVDEAGAKGGLPGRMPAERARAVARALGAEPDSPAVRALLDDYDAAVEAVRAAVPGIRGARPGGTERFPAADAAGVAAILSRAMPALAAADDALIAGLGAVGGADEASVGAVRAERAAERLWSARHGITPYGEIGPTLAGGVFLGGCVAVPGIPDADRAGARAAWAAWAPSIRAAAERAFAADRETAPEMIQQYAAMRERFAEAGAGNASAISADVGADAFRRQGELVARMAAASADLTRAAVAGRRAILEVLGPEGKAAFDAAWLRAAAPKVYADRKDAMAALDAAYGIAGLSDAQRTQVNALRGEHSARHGALCDRLATLFVESRGGSGMPGDSAPRRDAEQRTADLRFERAELNARTLRRLRAALTPEQAAAIPALSPAPTPPEPVRASP